MLQVFILFKLCTELVGDHLSQRPKEVIDVDQKSIIVDGLPTVDANKKAKLEGVLKKKMANATNIHIVFDEELGQSKGLVVFN